MLYDKEATLYTMSRNSSMVSSWTTWATFKCNIQPLWDTEWIWWIPAYNQFRLYTSLDWIKEWDKIIANSETYIVKSVDPWKWVLGSFSKVIMEKSRWS